MGVVRHVEHQSLDRQGQAPAQFYTNFNQIPLQGLPIAARRINVLVRGEYTLDSEQSFDAKPGDTFAVHLGIRVDTTTKAMPEFVCYDDAGRELPMRSSLVNAPANFPTFWQDYRRVFPVQPGTARVRARVRVSGEGEVLLTIQTDKSALEVESQVGQGSTFRVTLPI